MNDLYTVKTGYIDCHAYADTHAEALTFALVLHPGQKVGKLAEVTGPDGEPW